MMTNRNVIQATLWILVTAIQLQNYMAAPSTSLKPIKTNTTSNVRRGGLSPQASIGIPRRLPSPWAGKFPALRGRQRTSTTTTTTTTTPEPQLNVSTALATNNTREDSSFRRRMDLYDSASADNNPLSVVWPLRSRQAASKRLRIQTPTTPAPQLLLKLLQPKPTRPAIYSLDGFVPKPSIQRIVSTEAPLHFKKTDLQLLSSVPRRRKINRYSKEDEDDDDYQYVPRRRRKKPVSRYTAFARKGIPGEDYPVYTYIPRTDFECEAELGPGLYADPFTDCQVWHMCPGGNLSPRHSFLCPNGTIFNQKKRICDWWYNVDCRKHSRKIRSSNDDLGDGGEAISIAEE